MGRVYARKGALSDAPNKTIFGTTARRGVAIGTTVQEAGPASAARGASRARSPFGLKAARNHTVRTAPRNGTLPEKPTWREREVAEQARRSDYRWVRKHLSRTDPHFTYDVARKLFEMVAEHPEVGKLSPVRHGQWSQWLHDAQATAAFDLDEAQNQGELFAFVPVVQQQRFAEAIVELLERDGTENGKRPFSRSRKSLIAKTIELWLRREGGRMAYHLGTIYPRRIVNNFPKINEKQCHEVFMAAHDTAFIIERGLLKSKAKRATTRNVKN